MSGEPEDPLLLFREERERTEDRVIHPEERPHTEDRIFNSEERPHIEDRVIHSSRSRHVIRRRLRRMGPSVAGIGALAFVAVVTLLAMRGVVGTGPGAAGRAEPTVEQAQTASVTPPADVPRPGRPPSRIEALRSDVVTAALPAAPRRAVVAQPARAPSPTSVTEPARTAPPIDDGVARDRETLPARIVTLEAGSSPVAAVETPPPAAIPSRALLTPVAGDSGAPAASLLPSTRIVAPATAIETVLDRYALAFSMLDVRRAKSVWPGVNERSLERAFGSLEMQEFDLGACDIALTPPRAVATCNGSARYVPKVGIRNVRSEPRRWTFRLQQRGQDWSIDSVDTR